MKDESDVYMLFHTIWKQFLEFKFPTAGPLLMDDWLKNTSIVIQEGQLLCMFNAPIEWADFQVFYGKQIALIDSALNAGLEKKEEQSKIIITVPECSECPCRKECTTTRVTRDDPNPECLDQLEAWQTKEGAVDGTEVQEPD